MPVERLSTDSEKVTDTESGCAPQSSPITQVLLVEDNRDAAEGLSELLEMYGHRVRVARDGGTALDALHGARPDVVLVDIGLPDMDGYEVARRVRANKALRDVVLIALTGFGREEDKHHALAAGFDHHLPKPVDLEELKELVARYGPNSRPN